MTGFLLFLDIDAAYAKSRYAEGTGPNMEFEMPQGRLIEIAFLHNNILRSTVICAQAWTMHNILGSMPSTKERRGGCE